MKSIRIVNGLLRIFFKLLYHQMAWSYDFVAGLVSLGRWKQWVLALLPDIRGPLVLEVGPGPGHLLLAMRRKGYQAFGLDESRQMVSVSRKRLRSFRDRAVIVNGYAQFLPFRDSLFNTLVATFPSEFFFDPRFLTQAHRVLAPDGELLALPAAWITGNRWMDHLAAWLFHTTGQNPLAEVQYTHPLIQAGFQVKIEYREVISSRLLIIHATKP
jgi:ubiquinone/menaquinone biosynthesis C-methylase UbiE